MTQTVMNYVGGADWGNSGTKLTLTKINKTLLAKPIRELIPNAIKQVAKSEYRASMSGLEQTMETLDVLIKCSHLPDLNNKRFFVGPLAVKQKEIETGTDRKKTKNPYLLVPLLTSLALQMGRSEEEMNFHLMCALPVEEFKELEQKERIQFVKSLEGRFEVEFVTTAKLAGWKAVINLHLQLNVEGLPQIYDQMVDFNLQIKKDWAGEAVGGLDIGAFSTDLPILVWDSEKKRHKPDSALSTGFQSGTATALDGIRKVLKKENGINVSRRTLESYLKNKEYVVPYGSSNINIEEIAKEHLSILADDISYRIHDLMNLQLMFEIRRFIPSGGGTLLLDRSYFAPLEQSVHAEFVWCKSELVDVGRSDKVESVIFKLADGLAKLAMMTFKV